jgi:glycosyltransferase involved in cell wall biosynthesis
VTSPRILFVQPVLPRYRIPVFAGLAKRGYEVTCWSDHHPRSSLGHVDPGGLFHAEHRPESPVGPFVSQRAFLEAVRSADFDAIVLPWNIRYLELFPALAIAKLRELPCLVWGHARSQRERAVTRFLRNQAGRAATACIVYDREARAELIDDGFEPARTFVAQNAVDDSLSRNAQSFWHAHPADLSRFKLEKNLGDAPVALFISRLTPEKHVDILLRAFSRVISAVPHARLVIVGDGPEREKLEGLASSLDLKECVTFAGAIHDERALALWFMTAQLMAYPTNVGLSILHAFSYGLPVITSDRAIEHNPEFFALSHEKNGLTYRSGDEAHFAAQIISCLTDPDLQQRLARGAKQTVEAPGGFNLTTMLDGMEAALRFALEQRA